MEGELNIFAHVFGLKEAKGFNRKLQELGHDFIFKKVFAARTGNFPALTEHIQYFRNIYWLWQVAWRTWILASGLIINEKGVVE